MKKNNKIINTIILLIIIIQPVLELIYFNGTFEIFNLQLSTFIRLLIFGILSLCITINYKNLKYKSIFIIYLIMICIYFILHHLNALNFNSYIPDTYGIFEEFAYILRLLIPIFLIYYTVNIDIKEKKINKAIIISTSIISLIIIVTNLFKFSICSYGYGPIEGNIIDWFVNKGKYNYLTLASRGLFNHVTIFYIIILTSPLIFYNFLKTNSRKTNILLTILIFIYLVTAFMVGTKATTYGFIIILILYVLLNLFFTLIKKEYKISWWKSIFLIVITIISFIIIPYSPMMSRNNIDAVLEEQNIELGEENKDLTNNVEIEEIKEYLGKEALDQLNIIENTVNINEVLPLLKDEETKKDFLIGVIEKRYMNYGLTSKFIEVSYSYKDDPIFWKQFVDSTELYERSNNRMVIEKIYKRVLEVNDNKYDKLLGITYSRTSKIFNLERDFLYQTYSIGIIGTILLVGPFIAIILLCGIYILKNFKREFNLKNCSLMLGIGLTLCLAYYSGNTIDSLGITMILGIMCGLLIKNLLEKTNIKKEVQYDRKNKKKTNKKRNN